MKKSKESSALKIACIKSPKAEYHVPSTFALDKESRRMEAIKRISSSRENTVAFLKKAGICDENGKLASIYR